MAGMSFLHLTDESEELSHLEGVQSREKGVQLLLSIEKALVEVVQVSPCHLPLEVF